MESLKQIKNDIVYNFIYEIQHFKLNGENFAFFDDVILNYAAFNAIKDVTYDLTTKIDFTDVKINDKNLSEMIRALPSSLQPSIALRASIGLIDLFIKTVSIDNEVVNLISSDLGKDLISVLEFFKNDLLPNYKEVYRSTIEELIQYAEQNGIEISESDRCIPVKSKN